MDLEGMSREHLHGSVQLTLVGKVSMSHSEKVRQMARNMEANRHYRREAPAVVPTVAGVWRWDGESRSAAAEGRATDRGGWGLLIWYTPGFHGNTGKTGIRQKRSKA